MAKNKLTKANKKIRRKLVAKKVSWLVLYSLMFVVPTILTISWQYGLFEAETEKSSLTGYGLIAVVIIGFFFWQKIKEWVQEQAAKKRSPFIKEMLSILPFVLALGIFYYIHLKIWEIIIVLSFVILFRLISAPFSMLHNKADDELDLFDKSYLRFKENQSYDEFLANQNKTTIK